MIFWANRTWGLLLGTGPILSRAPVAALRLLQILPQRHRVVPLRISSREEQGHRSLPSLAGEPLHGLRACIEFREVTRLELVPARVVVAKLLPQLVGRRDVTVP